MTGRSDAAQKLFVGAKQLAPLLTEADAGLATVAACKGQDKVAEALHRPQPGPHGRARPADPSHRGPGAADSGHRPHPRRGRAAPAAADRGDPCPGSGHATGLLGDRQRLPGRDPGQHRRGQPTRAAPPRHRRRAHARREGPPRLDPGAALPDPPRRRRRERSSGALPPDRQADRDRRGVLGRRHRRGGLHLPGRSPGRPRTPAIGLHDPELLRDRDQQDVPPGTELRAHRVADEDPRGAGSRQPVLRDLVEADDRVRREPDRRGGAPARAQPHRRSRAQTSTRCWSSRPSSGRTTSTCSGTTASSPSRPRCSIHRPTSTCSRPAPARPG